MHHVGSPCTSPNPECIYLQGWELLSSCLNLLIHSLLNTTWVGYDNEYVGRDRPLCLNASAPRWLDAVGSSNKHPRLSLSQ